MFKYINIYLLHYVCKYKHKYIFENYNTVFICNLNLKTDCNVLCT